MRTSARVHLVDHGQALLTPFSEKSHDYALDKLTDHGVKVTFGVAVTQVDPDIGAAVRRHASADQDGDLGRRRIGLGDRLRHRRDSRAAADGSTSDPT